MPYFMTCDQCGRDFLCHDDFRPEPDIDYETVCQRCFDLCYRATEIEKQKHEAYRQARESS